MGRQAPRARSRRRFAFDNLERRTLQTAGLTTPTLPNEITALYQAGFSPTGLHLNASATLADGHLRLTDGGSNQDASAYAATPVDVSGDFTTTFRFQLTPAAGEPLGSGFTFEIQNDLGVTEQQAGDTDQLGLTGGNHLAVAFGTYDANPWAGSPGESSDNFTGLYLNGQYPSAGDTRGIPLDPSVIDLHSGHVFQVTLHYAAAAGTLGETIGDTSTGGTWTHQYAGINISQQFKLADVSGASAYAGFTASTGAPTNPLGYSYGRGRSTQDVTSWTWTPGSAAAGPVATASTAPALPYNGRFTLAAAATTSGAVMDADGHLVRTLWQSNALQAGTYTAAWDGLDQYGQAVNPATNPGPYRFNVVQNSAKATTAVVGNDTADPSDSVASLNPLGMWGVAVSPDGSQVWAGAAGGDTAGGGSIKFLDGSGTVLTTPTSRAFNYDHGFALAADSGFLYEAVETSGWDGGFQVLKINLANQDVATGFTDSGRANPDGSTVTTEGGNHVLRVLNGATGYEQLPGLAVTNLTDPTRGSIYVTDVTHNLVHQYDKVTGDQVGTPIAVVHPTGIAVDPAGEVWVAHSAVAGGPATVLSVYTPAGALIRNVTEAAGLADVWSLAVAAGNLYVADSGAGRVDVYAMAGSALVNGAHPTRIGRPASYGDDDGRTTLWDLRGVAADAQGNVYTVQGTAGVGASGAQVEKWSPAGVPVWVKGAYEYQSIAGAVSPDDPTTLFSSSLHRYTLDQAAGTWRYDGSAAYPGYLTNAWSGLANATPSSPPAFVKIGGTEFLVTATYNRVLFDRVGAGGELHPSLIMGEAGLADGHVWTWNDPAGDGVPQASQITDAGVRAADFRQITADGAGNLWVQTVTNTLDKVPLAGLDAHGNPLYDWSKAAQVLTLPASFQTFAVGDDGVYVDYVDAGFGPGSSASVYENYSLGTANALEKFDLGGKLDWRIALPEYSQSMAVIPGGLGVMVGSQVGSTVYRVDPSGQVVGMLRPLSSGDWLDFKGGALAVDRDPAAGKFDVFTEGIGYGDNEWYRLDLTAADPVLQGYAVAGAPAVLTAGPLAPAAPAAPSTPSLAPADDTGPAGDGPTSVRRPHLVGTATPGLTVQLVDASGIGYGSATAGADGAYSIPVSGLLGDGTYRLAARGVGADGGLSATSLAFTFTVDGTAPAAPAAPSPAAGQAAAVSGFEVAASRQPTLIGTAEPGATVDLMDLAGDLLATTTASAADGRYTVRPATPLPFGLESLRVRARDQAGNQGPAGPLLGLMVVDPAVNDFSGAGVSSLAVFNPATAVWYVGGAGVATTAIPFGWSGHDVPVPAAYDPGATELAVYRIDTAQWFVRRGPLGKAAVRYGWAGHDQPVPGDYDVDGQAELAVYRPQTGQWFVRHAGSIDSTTFTPQVVSYGWAGHDQPVPGDYLGQGRDGLSVYRSATGQWFARNPTTGVGALFATLGRPGDVPAPGDYDGIGRTEPAVYRPSAGQFLIFNPLTGTTRAVTVGVPYQTPAPGDYTGSRRTDPAVTDPVTGVLTYVNPADGTAHTLNAGLPAATVPLSSPFAYRIDAVAGLPSPSAAPAAPAAGAVAVAPSAPAADRTAAAPAAAAPVATPRVTAKVLAATPAAAPAARVTVRLALPATAAATAHRPLSVVYG